MKMRDVIADVIGVIALFVAGYLLVVYAGAMQ